ncbi:MAG: hypothetical protein M3Q96_03935, partial [Pseudomonadota bacterium]|nr:hypothetical protein [Pseudomonadota bacterium]
TSVYSGADPVLANIAQRMLRPLAISPLARAANQTPPTAPAFPFPSPLLVPLYDPPLRAKLDPGQEDFRKPVVDRLDVGALQVRDIDEFVDPIPMNGSPPLIPPKRSSFNSPGASSGSTHAGTPAGIQSALRAASRVSGLAVRRCARVPSSQRSVLWSWAISPQSAFRVLVAMARCAAALR